MTENEISEFFEVGGSPRLLEAAVRGGTDEIKKLAETLAMPVRALKSIAARWGLNGAEIEE